MKVKEYLKTCDQIYHTTLDPKNSGVVRIHLIPPKKKKVGVAWVVIINGYSVLPLETSWAILLKEFMNEINKTNGRPLSDEDVEKLVDDTIINVKEIFPSVPNTVVKDDLNEIIKPLIDISKGIEPTEKIGYMTLAKYAKYMTAPHRMDLMISAMEKEGQWNCNQKCLHCYACDEMMGKVKELSTTDWYKIIDKCREANIPSLTFTGGEPTIREDLVSLVNYASWFVTRLNTNGILLSKRLCEELYEASLDSVQITLYSFDKNIHNTLVGGQHFDEAIQGIKNALNANLDVSINTPLCTLNKDYLNLVQEASKLGVRYFSCSGLIPSGNANSSSKIYKLSRTEILNVIKDAYDYAYDNDLEISFTSPGWIDEKELLAMKMVVPSCGACLSNMAIAPNGDVIPCQSWLREKGLGNMLTSQWKTIWESKACKQIRKKATKNTQICLLKEKN